MSDEQTTPTILLSDVLPDSRMRNPKGIIRSPIGNMVPIFCANCGAEGGYCPEENMTFLFYQCQKCAEKYGQIAGTMSMPDEVFWKRVVDEQIEKYGRVLTAEEVAISLQDPLSLESKLAREREAMTPNAGG